MNIEERMKIESHRVKIHRKNINGTEVVEVSALLLPDVTRIAKEYAEECCQLQMELCANNAFKIKQTGLEAILDDKSIATMNNIIERIRTAPLATEEE